MKGTRPTPARLCVCNKCSARAVAILGKVHRRCIGSNAERLNAEGKTEYALRAKTNKLPTAQRGTWSE
jgi:hypothetical protein